MGAQELAVLRELAAVPALLGFGRRALRVAAGRSRLADARYLAQRNQSRLPREPDRAYTQGSRRRSGTDGEGGSAVSALRQAHAARQPLVPDADAAERRSRD